MPRHNGTRPVYSAITGNPARTCNNPGPVPLGCCGFYVGDVPFYPQSIRFITSGLAPCCNTDGVISSKLTFFGGDYNLQANVPRTPFGCYFQAFIEPGDLGTPTGYKRTYYSDPNCSVFESEDGAITPLVNPTEVGLQDVWAQDGCDPNTERNWAYMRLTVATIEPYALGVLMPRLDCANRFWPNQLRCNFNPTDPEPTCLQIRWVPNVAGGGVNIIPQDYAPLDPGFGPEDFL